MPLASQTLISSIKGQLHISGYADIGMTNTTTPTLEVAKTVASILGAVTSDSVQRLNGTQIGIKRLNTYGGNYGLGDLPLHTDLAHWHRPPRYVLLRCVAGSKGVSTRVLDRYDLERYISPLLMRRALFSPRRPLDGKLFLLRMLTPEAIRWDSLFLIPKNSSAREVVESIAGLALQSAVHNIVLAEPGHTIVLDNWRVMHGRSAVPTTEIGRSLDRVYLDQI